VGASGRIDPKEVLAGGVLYVRPEFKIPRCEICDAGDIIPTEERFFGSKIIRPNTPPMPIWKLTISRLKFWYNRAYDLMDQRSAVKATSPPK
jgi:hypothetical protein